VVLPWNAKGRLGSKGRRIGASKGAAPKAPTPASPAARGYAQQFLHRRIQGKDGWLHWPDDMRSAYHTWIQLIVEMDAAFDRSWPYDVAHAIRLAHTVWEAKDCLAKLERFAGREE
jgi:hypothetical protein